MKIKAFFKEVTKDFTDDMLKKIFKVAIEKFTKRMLIISYLTGFLSSIVFYNSILAFVFVFVFWIYFIYTTWQKTKETILESKKEQ